MTLCSLVRDCHRPLYKFFSDHSVLVTDSITFIGWKGEAGNSVLKTHMMYTNSNVHWIVFLTVINKCFSGALFLWALRQG
jgi:hypothetical protein